MASGTLISRVLGMVRVVLIGFILGYGTRQADMFSISQMVPNSIYFLFAGGALNSVLVPQIVRAIKNDEDGGQAYTNRMMTAFMLVVTVVTLVATVGAPLVTTIYTSSEWRSPELASQYQSILALVYLTLPQIFFLGAFFLLGQILNAREEFAPMMWAPITNNVVSIAVLTLYLVVWGNQQDHSLAFTPQQITLLGVGSTLGIVVQMLVLMPYVRKVGFKLRPRFDLKGVGLGRTFSLAKWTLAYVAVNQLGVIIVNRLATTATAAGHGAGLNVYSNAYTVWILPHSLITVSLATAMLTNTSRLAASGDMGSVVAEFIKTTRLGLVAIVPSAVAFMALSGPMVALLFSHGSGSRDAVWIAWALLAFALGLIPFTIQFMGLRTFYALEDTRTPFLLQSVISAVNIALALAFVASLNTLWPAQASAWIAASLALAYSLAFFVGACITWVALHRRLPALGVRTLIMHIVRLVLSSGLGGVAAYFAGNWVLAAMGGGKLAALVACVVGGVLILGFFLGLGKLMKVRELASLSTLIANRLGRRRGGKPSDEDSQRNVASLQAAEGQGAMLVDDLVPTQINPVVFDDGPATVVRNRAPVPERTFDEPPTVEEDAVDEPDVAPIPGDDEDELERTGPLDMAALFAEDDEGRVASTGTLLNTRYELIESLAVRHGRETWRAHDQVLSRDVVVHVIAPGDPRTSELMVAARKGAAATDSRFLRVLDADEFTEPVDGIGAYVVAEYAAGRSLTQLLAKGPLSSIEAAHITRELADALTGVHAQGLFHEQINPENVIITNAGAVRIVGFGVETALVGGEELSGWAAREEADVEGMGKVLYATLVRHWPGGPAWGLPAAPVANGVTVPARQLGASISPALDRIANACLSTPGGLGERRITTASQLAGELTQVLGTADASADLEQRVRAWRSSEDMPVVSEVSEPIDLEDDEPTTTQVAGALPSASGDDEFPPPEKPKPRRVLWAIVTLSVLALLVSLAYVAINNGTTPSPGGGASGGTSTPAGEGTSTAPQGAIQVVSATAFDPSTDGGDGEENNDDAGLAVDGDSGTAWKTTRYHNRGDMGGLKPGVGLMLDLGEKRTITAAEVTLTGPSVVELRVPKGDEGSTRTEADWLVVASNDSAEGTVTLSPEQPVETQWVLVYVTNTPKVADNRYQTEISEIKLR